MSFCYIIMISKDDINIISRFDIIFTLFHDIINTLVY